MPKDHKRRSGGDYKVRRAQRGRLHQVFVKSHVNPDDPLVKKGCTTKKKYPTKQRVSAAARGSERRSGWEHSWYHCKYCGSYHITRVRDGEGRFIKVGSRNLIPTVVKLEKPNVDASTEPLCLNW